MYYVQSRDTGTVYHVTDPAHWPGYEVLSKAKGKAAYRTQTILGLLAMLKPGDTVYTCLRSVSRSGMSRQLTVHVVRDGEIHNITRSVAITLDWTMKGDNLSVGGCGMDMGFHTVYSLGRVLFPDGADKGRGGRPDTDGGYALTHQWV